MDRLPYPRRGCTIGASIPLAASVTILETAAVSKILGEAGGLRKTRLETPGVSKKELRLTILLSREADLWSGWSRKEEKNMTTLCAD